MCAGADSAGVGGGRRSAGDARAGFCCSRLRATRGGQLELARRGAGRTRVFYPGQPEPSSIPYTSNPKPFTLHFTLHYTLHTTRYALHPTHCTLHPTPYTLHTTRHSWWAARTCTPRCWLHARLPSRSNLSPQPYPVPHTLHPTPYTLHPTPFTLHSTHSTLHLVVGSSNLHAEVLVARASAIQVNPKP